MKVAVVESAGKLIVTETPEPQVGEYDALCELLYGATCAGTDTHLIACHKPFCNWVRTPFILGHESVGRVVKIGKKVRNFRVGDVVTRVGAPGGHGLNVGWGGFAGMGLARDHWAMAIDGLPRNQWTHYRVNQVVHPSIDPTVAPMFTTWRETLSTSIRLGIGAGSAVLIAGSGGNGLAFAVHARNLGAKVIVMLGSSRVEHLAREAGVSHYVEYQSPDIVKQLAGVLPDGVDFAIDTVGKSGVADQLLPAIRHGGKYLTYGMDEIDAIRFNPALARGEFTVMPCSYDEAETHQQVSEFVLQGKLDAKLWYDAANPCPLENIPDAFVKIRNREALKVLVKLH